MDNVTGPLESRSRKFRVRSEFLVTFICKGADLGLDCVFPGKYEKIIKGEKIVEHVCRGVMMTDCVNMNSGRF